MTRTKEGRTGVVIPVAAADPLLSAVAETYPGAVREGVPAHISILYPFVSAEELDGDPGGDAERVLAGIAEKTPPTEVTFARCQRMGGFVYLQPETLPELDELSAVVRGHWPDVLPYGGAVDDVGPHLTVAMRTSDETAAAIERDVAGQLPMSTELREMWLVVFAGGWRVRRRFRFAGDR